MWWCQKTSGVAYVIIYPMSENIKNEIPLVIVAGMGKTNRVIGNENKLLWHIPADMKRFKQLTLGHPIIMGRKTFESILNILGKPLPERTNIVITRDKNYKCEGIKIAHTLDEALEIAKSEKPTEIHIGGGAEIYRQTLPLVSKLYITWFFDHKEGDTFFPDFMNDFEIVAEHPSQTHEDMQFQWIDYERKKA
jgi:dihydrofolate reductase